MNEGGFVFSLAHTFLLQISRPCTKVPILYEVATLLSVSALERTYIKDLLTKPCDIQ